MNMQVEHISIQIGFHRGERQLGNDLGTHFFSSCTHAFTDTQDDKFKFTIQDNTVSGLQNSMKAFANFHALIPHQKLIT